MTAAWKKGSSGQITVKGLGGENDRWKMIPEGQKGMESVAPNKVLGNCYFQIEFEAWIQHSKK